MLRGKTSDCGEPHADWPICAICRSSPPPHHLFFSSRIRVAMQPVCAAKCSVSRLPSILVHLRRHLSPSLTSILLHYHVNNIYAVTKQQPALSYDQLIRIRRPNPLLSLIHIPNLGFTIPVVHHVDALLFAADAEVCTCSIY